MTQWCQAHQVINLQPHAHVLLSIWLLAARHCASEDLTPKRPPARKLAAATTKLWQRAEEWGMPKP